MGPYIILIGDKKSVIYLCSVTFTIYIFKDTTQSGVFYSAMAAVNYVQEMSSYFLVQLIRPSYHCKASC